MDTDITSLPIVYDGEKIDSRFRLVMVASQRARFVMEKGKGQEHGKATIQAIAEATRNDLVFVTGDDAIKALDARKHKEQKKRHQIINLVEDNIANEVRKDLDNYLHHVADAQPVAAAPGSKNEADQAKK